MIFLVVVITLCAIAAMRFIGTGEKSKLQDGQPISKVSKKETEVNIITEETMETLEMPLPIDKKKIERQIPETGERKIRVEKGEIVTKLPDESEGKTKDAETQNIPVERSGIFDQEDKE